MAKKVVLVISDEESSSVPEVLDLFKQTGQPFYLLNVGSFFKLGSEVTISIESGKLTGEIGCYDGSILDLDRVKSVWFRRPMKVSVTGDFDELERGFIEDEISSSMWSLYSCMDGVFWMNHPLAAKYILEHNKLFQLRVAKLSGLAIPKTIITNNPRDLENFCLSVGNSIAVKVVRSRIFQNDDGTATGIYTNRVSIDEIREKRASFSLAPVMAQEYVEKQLELRVTVVGKNIHACAIHSQDSERTKEDWRRYDFVNVLHEKFELPTEIKNKLFDFMRRCGISFGAIDMILTPDNQYVFLEVNPSGQFGWIENLTGLPISESIARTLSECS